MILLDITQPTDKLFIDWILWLNLAFCLLLSPVASYGSTPEKLFILHSYSQEYPWTRDQHAGFVTNYIKGTDQQALISTEYLDTKRVAYTKAYADFFAQYLKEKYSNYQPSIVYVTDDNAVNFAIDHIGDIFPEAVIIFSGVNNYTLVDKLDSTRITGVFEKKEIVPNIELLRLIDPDVNEILVVGDGSNTYQAIKQEIRHQLINKQDIDARYIASNNIEQLKTELAQSTQKYLILTTIGAITDESGNQLGLKKIIEQIATAGNFVIISMEDAYLHKGVLGGYVTSGKQQGQTAAGLVLSVERGHDISRLTAVTDSPNLYIFDFQELTRHQLEPPPEILARATILHRPTSFYEKNRLLIMAAIIALTLLLFLSMATFLRLLTLKNRKIQSTSDKLARQTQALEATKTTLTEAQRIVHLGNWEWDMASAVCYWSDEMYRILGEQPQSFLCDYEKLLCYVHDDDKAIVNEKISNALQQSQSYVIEHRLFLQDNSIKYVRQTGNIYCDSNNKPTRLIGTLLDISTIKNNERKELERLEQIERYQGALLDWSLSTHNNIGEAFHRATEISARTLNIGRVSIWLYDSKRTALICHDLYSYGAGHDCNLSLSSEDFPDYFKAIENGKIMAIDDARTDDRSREFTKSYLIPNNIYSMLDIPIFYEGEITGVVCHEHTGGYRNWQHHEQEFASAISNKISLSLEIENRKQAEKELEHQAYHDVLTNLPNRSLFMDRLNQAIKLAHRTDTQLAVMFLDLDNFKEINDSLGHSAGDHVLITIANKLQSCLREVDTISRLGGDEYSLIMGSFKQPQEINQIALKLFDELQKPITIDGHDLYVTSSIGISIYPEDGVTPDTLLRNADAAMYKAKEEGRNSFQFYTQDMTERAFERVLMESNLHHALKCEEFIVYYQPQYDASDDSVVGMEALVRWSHPEMGLISPAKFIPVAEQTGLIVQLDRWVFTTAVRQWSDWYRQGFKPGRLALNLAMKQLMQDDLLDFITDVLAATQCQPQWLTFEVTESQIMNKPEQAIAILQKISDLGIEIAVDDFGTGYSSLAYLKRLPVDKLKIDQSFVHDVPGDDEDVAIVCAVIALAKSMKLSVIAEGVEKIQQKDFLLRHGCNLIQGYLYNAPMPASDIEQLFYSDQYSQERYQR